MWESSVSDTAEPGWSPQVVTVQKGTLPAAVLLCVPVSRGLLCSRELKSLPGKQWKKGHWVGTGDCLSRPSETTGKLWANISVFHLH